jgi:D-alanine--poly(phosphoribitol) ligase subunit 1
MNTKPYTYDKTVTQLFEKAVLRYPENIAVYLDKDQITYRQFNEDINQYAHFLRANGVTKNHIVAVELPRSYEMLCIIFSIIKAGGTYLFVSPDYPEKRKEQIIADAGISFLIIHSSCDRRTSASYHILKLPDDEVRSYSKMNLASLHEPTDTAYVIYTSGSTGTPKGVMIAHHSLINRIEWMQDVFPIGPKDILFQKTHCGFDVSIWELFWWAITGAGVTLLPHGKEDDIILMVKIIIEKKVTVIHFVPPLLKIFLEYLEIGHKVSKLESLRFVFSSGEALDANTANIFNQLFHTSDYPQLVNLYGPTEATIDVTYFVCDKKTNYQEIPIGKPIYNVELMVLDEFLKPLQFGERGELFISGVCLAKGYLNNPTQTKHCFLQLPNVSNKIIYKTGDLVQWNSDGELCYFGRKDQQVKLNGIRIELSEIEHQLKTYHKITDAIVLCIVRGAATKRLVAFIKPKNKSVTLEDTDLRSFILMRLPSYMVPQDYVIIDEYPLKENGKLDRKRLEKMYTYL